MVRKRGDEITGINRNVLLIPIPQPVRYAFEGLPADVLIDGKLTEIPSTPLTCWR